jgi:hypothetical protein
VSSFQMQASLRDGGDGPASLHPVQAALQVTCLWWRPAWLPQCATLVAQALLQAKAAAL